MLTLYRAADAWADQELFLAFVALREKRLDFEVKVADAAERGRALAGRLPAVADGEHFVSEGIAVAEYLAETYPYPKNPRLFPPDFRQRAHCRQVMLWPRVDLAALRAERPASVVLQPRACPPLSPAARSDAERLVHTAEQLLSHGGRSLFGEWCIADTDFAFTLQRLNLGGHPLPPAVRTYVEAQWERPAVRGFLAGP